MNHLFTVAPLLGFLISPEGILLWTFGKGWADLAVDPRPYLGKKVQALEEALPEIAEALHDVSESSSISRSFQNRFYDFYVFPLPDGSRLAVAFDVTKEKELQEKLARDLETSRKHVEALEELANLKEDFLSTTSHELRTPLTAIQGYLKLLFTGAAGEISAQQKELLETALRNTARLKALVDDLLDLSCLEAGKMQPVFQEVDIAPLFANVQKTLQPAAREKNMTFTVEVFEPSLKLKADPAMLERIVLNLAANAVKFTPQGGSVVLRAKRAMEDGSPFLLLEVEDNGPGIPEHELSRIFEKFHQVDHSATRTAGGSGLGLAIVKKLVELHRADIRVQSKLGQGSLFTVRFPMHG